MRKQYFVAWKRYRETVEGDSHRPVYGLAGDGNRPLQPNAFRIAPRPHE